MPGKPMADAELLLNLSELERSTKLPPKERPALTAEVDIICDSGERYGLPNDAIHTLLKLITQKDPLDIRASRQILESLYPNEKVSKQCVYTIVSALGPGARKPKPAVQAMLIRWLILVQGALKDRLAISHVYAVLFNLLDFLGTRADMCHLLAVSTERRHVKPFRIDMLMDMQTVTGQDAALTGLMKTYRSFRPDLIPVEAVTSRSSTFEYPDERWKARIEALLQDQPAVSTLEDETQFRVLNKSIARSRASYIPHIYTRVTSEDQVTLENINGIQDFAENFDRLRLPTRMTSALNDPLLQHYLETTPSTAAERCFEAVDSGVSKALEAQRELLRMGEPLDRGCVEILTCGLSWAQRFKFVLPSIRAFCFHVLNTKQWNGYATLIIRLLAWSNTYHEPNWSKGILSSNHEASILSGEGDGPTLLLSLYTQMIYNRLPTVSTITLDKTAQDSLDLFAQHVSTLALSILVTNSAISAQLAVIGFLQALADIATMTDPQERQFSLVSFDRLSVYLLSFSIPNVAILSQLCNALADHKESIFRTAGVPDASFKNGLILTFNGFVMDTSNLLWRSRAFCADSKMDNNAAGCLLGIDALSELRKYVSDTPNISPSYSLHNFFTLSFHPALANIAVAPWLELEEEGLGAIRMDIDGDQPNDSNEVRHRGPVTRASLQRLSHDNGAAIDWLQFRLRVLRWLEERGATGLDRLMRRTIKALMTDGAIPRHLTSSQADSPMQL